MRFITRTKVLAVTTFITLSQAHSVRRSIDGTGCMKNFRGRKWLGDCLYSASQTLKLASLRANIKSFITTISLTSFTKEPT